MRIKGYPRARIAGDAMKIIVHGNSHVAGEGSSSTATRWTSIMAGSDPVAGSGVTVVNSGIGGQSITAMLGNAATAADAYMEDDKLNVLIVQEMGNEMAANGRNAAAAHTKLIQYCNARRAVATAQNKRLYIIVVGLHPTGAATTYAETLARIASVRAANELMRANFRSYADQFVDLALYEPFANLFASEDFTIAGFTASGMYNRSDGVAMDRVHLGNAGHALLGRGIALELRRIRSSYRP